MKQHRSEEAINTSSFRNLLGFLLIYLFGSPFLTPYPSLAIFAHLMLSAILFFSIYSVAKYKHHRSIAIALLPVVLVLYWLGIFEFIRLSKHGAYVMQIAYFGLLIWSYAGQLRKTERVTLGVLYATLCFYLIMGMLWGSAYTLMYLLSPDSFSGALLEQTSGNHLIVFNYFSMVTLTTLGYGDITPQTPGAGALCQMEAIFGQYFIAVIIAWLVGNYAADRRESGDKVQK
ncbi:MULTISPECIES: potassium channel family protein [Desulfosediminicola]|uniref:potassium channel family protein n=1 Tax=Desulfosediminicola TaxID=2886823 RepID=UPI0010AC4347|nr:potassium channel family protein [Desulfosediminicola ganghwensis]